MVTVTREQALTMGLKGWDILCNRCGSYGAAWVKGERPGVGALALCPIHHGELRMEYLRHEEALRTLRQVNYEQPPEKKRWVTPDD